MPASTGRPSPEFLGQVHGALLAFGRPVSAESVSQHIGRPRLSATVTNALRELGDLGLAERRSHGWLGVRQGMRGNTPPPRPGRELTVELEPDEDTSDPATMVQADELDAWVAQLSKATRRALDDHLSARDWTELRALLRL